VVIVIVRDQHHVDRGQVLEGDAGVHEPARTEAQWAGVVVPVRVGEDVDPVELDEERRVPDPGHGRVDPVGA
jgi:hypothetical protein